MPAADAVEPARAGLRPGQRIAIALLRAYQLMLSPIVGGSCRFVPSCSAYAVDAVTRFGVMRGTLLAVRRLSRCRPFGPHGFDPVPGLTSHEALAAGGAPERATLSRD